MEREGNTVIHIISASYTGITTLSTNKKLVVSSCENYISDDEYFQSIKVNMNLPSRTFSVQCSVQNTLGKCTPH